MFIGRRDELTSLEEIYKNERNNLLIMYGRFGIGKTTLINKFLENRTALYYVAAEASELEQKKRLVNALGLVPENEELVPSYMDIFEAGLRGEGKRILVLEDFEQMLDEKGEFVKAVSTLMDSPSDKRCMIILVSSSVIFVEQRMVNSFGSAARKITGFMKLRPFSFAETVEMFPRQSVEDCILINAVFGGVPRYLARWQENRRTRENLLNLVLSPDASFYGEAEFLLKQELRELGAYNAILYALASGKNKLNDIFRATGFSRAKISVYIKNLIHMDLVEKVFSFDTRDKSEIQKGLYRIKDNFLAFWYRYVFPNKTELERGRAKNVFEDVVSADQPVFMREHFANVCTEFLRLMNHYGRLGHRYAEPGIWYGKKGRLDIVMQDDRRYALAAVCLWDDEEVSEQVPAEIRTLAEAAKLRLSEIYIFSKKGFSGRLIRMSTEDGSIHLVPLSSL